MRQKEIPMARRRTERPITIHQVAAHRNGISGERFYIVLFGDPESNPDGRMMAIHFPDTDGIYTAVLDIDQLSAGNIAFGNGNSWRGDQYHPEIIAAVQAYDAQEEANFRPMA
jgi:hypothetical protein